MATLINIIKTLWITQGSENVVAAGNKVAASSEQITKNQTRLGNASTNSARAFSTQSQGLGGLVGVYAAAAATTFALTAAFTALSKAAIASQTLSGLDTLAASAGTNSKIILEGIKNVTSGQLSLVASAETANLALSAGLGDSMIGLFDTGAKAARALGRDVTDSINRIIKGTAKLEPELLDELGIFVRIDSATEKYAASIGKTVTQLTEFERRQAFSNAVIAEGALKFKNINTFADTTATSIAKLEASISDLATSMFGFLAKVLTPMANFFSGAFGNQVLLFGGILALVFAKLRTVVGDFVTTSLTGLAQGFETKFLTIKQVSGEAAAKIADDAKKALGAFSKDADGKNIPAFRLGGKSSAEDLKLVKKTLDDIHNGEVLSITTVNKATEANQRLLDIRTKAMAVFPDDPKKQATYTAQIAALTGSMTELNAATSRASGSQVIQAGIMTKTGSILTGTANIVGKIVNGLGYFGLAIGGIQLAGSIIGKDFIGWLTEIGTKLFSGNEQIRNFKKGIDDLTASMITNGATFGISQEKLKEFSGKLSSEIANILKARTMVEAIRTPVDGNNTIDPRTTEMFRRRRTPGEGKPVVDSSYLLEATAAQDTAAKIANLTKKYEEYREQLGKGGEEARLAAIGMSVITQQIDLVRIGGARAIDAITQMSAITGIASGQLAKLITSGNLKPLSDGVKELGLSFNGITVSVTNTNGEFVKIGETAVATAGALQSSFTVFSEEMGRGALNAEGASRSLGAMRTAAQLLDKEILNTLINTEKITLVDIDRMKRLREMSTAYKDHISGISQQVSQLQQAELITKTIQEMTKSNIQAIPKMVFQGDITIGQDSNIAFSITPEEKRLVAAQNLHAFIMNATSDEANRAAVAHTNALAGNNEQLNSLNNLRDTLADKLALSRLLTANEAETSDINRSILDVETEIVRVKKENLTITSSTTAEQEKQLKQLIQAQLASSSKLVLEAGTMQRELQQQIAKETAADQIALIENAILLNNFEIAGMQQQIKFDEEQLNNKIKMKEIASQIAQLNIQAASQILSAQKTLNSAILEQLQMQDRITEAKAETNMINEQRKIASELGGLQSQQKVQEAFPELVSQEQVLKLKESIALKEFELQMIAINRKNEAIETEKNNKIRDAQETIKNLEIDMKIVALKGAAAKEEYKTQLAILTLKKDFDKKVIDDRLEQIKKEKDNISKQEEINNIKNEQAQKERNFQITLQERKMEAMNKEMANNTLLTTARAKITEQDTQNLKLQLRASGKIAEADLLDPEKFKKSITDVFNGLQTQNIDSLRTIRDLSDGAATLAIQAATLQKAIATQALDSEVALLNQRLLNNAKIFTEEKLLLEAKRNAAGAGATLELEALAQKVSTGKMSIELAMEEARSKIAANAMSTEEIQRTFSASLQAIRLQREETLKLFNDIADALKNTLTKAFEDLITAFSNGTLTMKSFTEGVRNLARAMLLDIAKEFGKSMLTKFIFEPLKKGFSSLLGSIFGESKNAPQDIMNLGKKATEAGAAGLGAGITPESISQMKLFGATPVWIVGSSISMGGGVAGAIPTPGVAAAVPATSTVLYSEPIGPPVSAAGEAATQSLSGLTEGATGLTGIFADLSKNGGIFGTIIGGLGTGLIGFFSFLTKGFTLLLQTLTGSSAAGGGGGFFGGLLGLFGGGGPSAAGTAIGAAGIGVDPTGIISLAASGGYVNSFGTGASTMRRMAGGGAVLRDRVPALLQPGEFVLRKPAVDSIGKPALERMNGHGAGGSGPSKVDIKIENSGSEKQATQGQTQMDGETAIIKIILKDLNSNGPIRKSIRGNT
jgi:hypothetical protein